MAAARSLSTDVNEDSDLAGLSHAAARLYLQALALADDHGNLPADPAWLAARVFWRQAADVAACIAEVVSTGLWEAYEASGKRYVHFRSWHKHQRIQIPGKPKHPLPPGWTCTPEPFGKTTVYRSKPPTITDTRDDSNQSLCGADPQNLDGSNNGSNNGSIDGSTTGSIIGSPSTSTSLLFSSGGSGGAEPETLESVLSAVPNANPSKLATALRGLESAVGRPKGVTLIQVARAGVAEYLTSTAGAKSITDPGPYLGKIMRRLLRPGELDKSVRAGSHEPSDASDGESLLDYEFRRQQQQERRGEASLADVLPKAVRS